MDLARKANISADETWPKKVRMVDFFILDAVYHDEMWILSQEQAFQLVSLNELQYGKRPVNIFSYTEPLKGKQKEMNLKAKIPGIPITERYGSCKNNFAPILNLLGMKLKSV